MLKIIYNSDYGRFEQLLPFPFDHAAEIAASYPNADYVWTQEEPKNMGESFA